MPQMIFKLLGSFAFCCCQFQNCAKEKDHFVPDRHEVLRKLSLEYVRASISFLERAIEFSIWDANLMENAGRPVDAQRFRKEGAKMRSRLVQLKRQERQLWEQQPGGISAPPPREAKR
jgi:hypothetical protein